MALKLDNNLINELGLGALPEHEKQLLLRQIYEKLEMNVGVRLADQMSNEQLDEFEKFVDANDDKGAFQWLESNFPNYKDVVNEEFEKLKAEIKQYAPQMLAVAQHNAAQQANGGSAPQQPQPQQPQPQYQQPQPGQYQNPAPQQPMTYPQQPQQQQYNPTNPNGQPQAPQPAQQPYYGPQQPQYQQPQPDSPQYPQQPQPGQYQYPPQQPGQQQDPQYPP
ncbi:MAG: hypothetical protein JWP13_347, partial [Candidatus Saccharibacteria bacterium]|nr:hypothetical protein [Candidatus Saccharibacteria bacterium]